MRNKNTTAWIGKHCSLCVDVCLNLLLKILPICIVERMGWVIAFLSNDETKRQVAYIAAQTGWLEKDFSPRFLYFVWLFLTLFHQLNNSFLVYKHSRNWVYLSEIRNRNCVLLLIVKIYIYSYCFRFFQMLANK